MARDDWRIRIELPEEHESFLARLGLDLGSEARDLARELEGRQLAVSQDENDLFVYASTGFEAEPREEPVGVLRLVELDPDPPVVARHRG